MRQQLWLAMIGHSERSAAQSRNPDALLLVSPRDPSTTLGMTVATFSSFLLENFDRFPRFVGWRLFVFKRALQIHLGQQIVGIEFQKT